MRQSGSQAREGVISVAELERGAFEASFCCERAKERALRTFGSDPAGAPDRTAGLRQA